MTNRSAVAALPQWTRAKLQTLWDSDPKRARLLSPPVGPVVDAVVSFIDALGAVLEAPPEPSEAAIEAARVVYHGPGQPPLGARAIDPTIRAMLRAAYVVDTVRGEAPPEPRDESAWLIESQASGQPVWWTGKWYPVGGRIVYGPLHTAYSNPTSVTDMEPQFSPDHAEALRFARKQDAERAVGLLPVFYRSAVRVNEHMWMVRGEAGPLPPPEEIITIDEQGRVIAPKKSTVLLDPEPECTGRGERDTQEERLPQSTRPANSGDAGANPPSAGLGAGPLPPVSK